MSVEKQSSSPLSGRALLVAAALLWSLSGVFVKCPPLASLPLADRGPLIACFRALAAGVCLLPFVTWRRVRLTHGMWPMVICFAAMNLLFVTAMTRTSAAAAIFLQYTSTLWAFVFGVIFLREPIRRENLVTLAFCLAGIGWIVVDSWHGERFVGNLMAIGSGMAYGGVVITLRHLREEDSVWLVVLNHLVSGAIVVPWVVWHGLVPTAEQAGLIVALGVLQMGLPYILFARGVRSISAQEASLTTLLEAILNPVWVWLLWGENVPTATLIGGSLILVGLVLRYVAFRPAADQNGSP
jgi:drug/metabolite transporter (DMT)-like permease